LKQIQLRFKVKTDSSIPEFDEENKLNLIDALDTNQIVKSLKRKTGKCSSVCEEVLSYWLVKIEKNGLPVYQRDENLFDVFFKRCKRQRFILSHGIRNKYSLNKKVVEIYFKFTSFFDLMVQIECREKYKNDILFLELHIMALQISSRKEFN